MWWPWLVGQLVASTHPDSLAVLKSARSAQADFESFRLEQLPWSRGGGRGGRCDEVVGRFCFWHEDDNGWRPAPEAAPIRVARSRLLHQLDSLAMLLPADGWIAGQQVRYLVESARYGEALALARSCQAAGWWCSALAGYVLHQSRAYAAADSAFAVALSQMAPVERCRWTDLTWLLDDPRGRYRKLDCVRREALERRIWWLADPLYVVPGNERRTEHLARRVVTVLQDDARSAYGVRWGSDLDELVMRYGWPVGWEREGSPAGDAFRPAIISHNDPKSWLFLPPARFVDAPNAIHPDDWRLDPDRPVTSYAPAYAAAFHDLPHQIAVFRRGTDSMVVVAGYDVRATKDEHRRAQTSVDEQRRAVTRVDAALVLARDESHQPLLSRGSATGPEGVVIAIAPAESALLSLETLDTADSVHAARARFWLPVPPVPVGVSLSDPLLLRLGREDSLPGSLAEAIPYTRGSARARRGERVGVFWETYGLDRHPGPVRITLTVVRGASSWLRHAAEWAGLASRERRYVSLSWEEPASGIAVYPRALVIGLPDAALGTFLLQIEVTGKGDAVARAERLIEIVPN